MNDNDIDTILVPAGSEYRAVCRGLEQIPSNTSRVIAIPIGSQGLVSYLDQWLQSQEFLNNPPRNLLLMGLGGSLSPLYDIGQIVIYQRCGQIEQANNIYWQECNPELTHLIYNHLSGKAAKVTGLTSDQLIWNAQEKQRLGQQYRAEVVDMEGYTILEKLHQSRIRVAIIRVISDKVGQTLPNLTAAITQDGSLQPFSLALTLIKHPFGSVQLIRGALKGLNILQQVTYQLFFSLKNQN